MKAQIQISICMPVYNASLYLRECIDSILFQSFTNFELLIVDDGSTDDSVEIVRSYPDSRIRLIKNKHDYIGSLNLLLQEAKGKYIARMDSDDIMMSNRLETQYAYMETHPDIDILGGSLKYFNREIEKIITYREDIITAGDLLNGAVLAHPTVMMRSSSMSNLRYNKSYIYAEDYHLWCQAFMAGLRMTNIPDVLIKYRLTNTNISTLHKEQQKQAASKARDELEEWLTEKEARYAMPVGTSIPQSTKKLTVIITFLNEGEELERTLSEIRKTVADAVEIIVINDGSYDGYAYGEKVALYNVHYLVNRHRLGVAASRDLGIALCNTPYFLLLDAHMRFYDRSWATRIVEELQANERQLLCCQGRILYKDEETGDFEETNGISTSYGAYFPFQKDSVWPDITWNYKEQHPKEHTESIPAVLGAAYAASKRYWQRLRGLEGLHNYGADEQYISLKVWLEGGRCTLLKDVVIGHIYRKKAPYLILGRDSIYNLMFIAKLLFPQNIYSNTVATAISLYREFAIEALRSFEEHKTIINELRSYFKSIFVHSIEQILPMHQACREYDEESFARAESLLSDTACHLQKHLPTDDGLMEGKTGALIWLCHYESFVSSNHTNVTALELYSIIETHVEEQRLSWNFRYGVSGIGWGLLYLYAKELINIRPDNLTDCIDNQLRLIQPESIKDYSLETGATGVLAYLTMRLVFGKPEKPDLPLDRWYNKAKAIFSSNKRQEVIYYAHLYCSIYEDNAGSLSPLIGIWLNAPTHLPQKINDAHYTLADGLLGTTLQVMSLLQTTKRHP